MPVINSENLAWEKGSGLLPAIIQDVNTGQVLMLGYMNADAFAKTLDIKRVTFYSRSKDRLWTKGETSGNWLDFVSAEMDCDADTILIQARPHGPVCHTGSQTCFNNHSASTNGFLDQLSALIALRHRTMPGNSYTTSLFRDGTARIAQKVGEEGVELALSHMKNDPEETKNEAADLLFHMMVLLEDADLAFSDVVAVLQERHKQEASNAR
jgi:phosphoribosyl-ATP pyrophosphohydrolase/phosphoribosyl-AMP cyclohydrolase